MIPRLKERMKGPVSDDVRQQFSVTNPMALPRLEKVVVSVGLGKQIEGTKINATAKETVLKDLAVICGQRPVMTRARKSVSNFKVRKGYENGATVTLRGNRMWEFFDRLVSLAIPRIKDFRGLGTNSFDGRGNYTFGVTEQGIFPEINMANTTFIHGMNITFVFRNSDDEKSKYVLGQLGMPFAVTESPAESASN